jgi:transposase
MFCLANSQLTQAYQLAQDFLVMVHKREGHNLDSWLQQAAQGGLPELQSFARCG